MTRSTQELRLLVVARRMRDPELTDFENDLLELIAQAKLGLYSRATIFLFVAGRLVGYF